MFPTDGSEPADPPLPTCRTPRLMLVPPLYVLLPVSVIIPPPVTITLPEPPMAAGRVWESARLKMRVVLAARDTPLVLPIEAPLPPLPMLSVPPLTLIGPE